MVWSIQHLNWLSASIAGPIGRHRRRTRGARPGVALVARFLAAATLLARSDLARVGVEVLGRADGEPKDGMRWQTEIEPVEEPSEHQSPALCQVPVTVAWGASPAEQLMLTTLRTGLSSE